jgi:ATP-dependent Clp protease ATP-binding subunit ClpB
VGKTEVARRISSYLFADDRSFIQLDMSEYQDNSTLTRLLGASPGYVGYEEGGQLTDRLRTTPYSVVLLDEIDKAAPRVFDLFLQLFEEGKLTDSQGRTADAKNAIFVMTGNIRIGKGIGFHAQDEEAAAKAALGMARQSFRPEFLNRIDEQIVFRPLSREDVRKVLDMQLSALEENLFETSGCSLRVEPEAREWLAETGYSPEYGVRELGRVIDRWVRGPISELSARGVLGRERGVHAPVVVRRMEEGIVVE